MPWSTQVNAVNDRNARERPKVLIGLARKGAGGSTLSNEGQREQQTCPVEYAGPKASTIVKIRERSNHMPSRGDITHASRPQGGLMEVWGGRMEEANAPGDPVDRGRS